jgi:hypothetical protein
MMVRVREAERAHHLGSSRRTDCGRQRPGERFLVARLPVLVIREVEPDAPSVESYERGRVLDPSFPHGVPRGREPAVLVVGGEAPIVAGRAREHGHDDAVRAAGHELPAGQDGVVQVRADDDERVHQ